ncbi:hypothetical protein Tco_0100984 [Tanacetum coccineum]
MYSRSRSLSRILLNLPRQLLPQKIRTLRSPSRSPPWAAHQKTYISLVLRHLLNDDFLGQYNVNLALQVAMGSQLRLRFEQEAKLLKKVVARVARQDQRIQAREVEIKNLEALLKAEADMKKAVEAKNVELSKELDSLRIQLFDL